MNLIRLRKMIFGDEKTKEYNRELKEWSVAKSIQYDNENLKKELETDKKVIQALLQILDGANTIITFNETHTPSVENPIGEIEGYQTVYTVEVKLVTDMRIIKMEVPYDVYIALQKYVQCKTGWVTEFKEENNYDDKK